MAAPPPPDPDFDPTVEIGTPNAGIAPWSAFYDSTEDVAELAWPRSIQVYNRMRNDEQIAALLLSFILPILGYRWYIKPNGARDEVVAHVAGDFGIPIEGADPDEPTGRQRDKFNFSDYLRHSMLKLSLGFMMFEQVYRLGDDQKLHVRKLAPRLPGSISQVQADRDGGLMYVRQYPSGYSGDPLYVPTPTVLGNVSIFGANATNLVIPVDRLVAHVCDKEGGNWYGKPWTRAVYRNWLIKDRLIRVDALKHERNGMGIPTGRTQQGVTQKALDTLLRIVTKWKAGENSAAALPPGTDIELKGVQGTLPDTLSSIRYHDEQMARRFVAMFMPLGSTQSGSRALGETFVDFFGLAQESVAKEFAETTTKYAIEDLIDLNYGIDEGAPILEFRAESDRALPTTDLVNMVNAHIITADSELEDYVRAEHDLPAKADPGDSAPPEPEPDPNAPPQQRDPSEVEQQSKVDFAGLKEEFNSALTQLVSDWNAQVKPGQIDELVALIGGLAADDLEGLASIQATPTGADVVDTAMTSLAAKAADRATQEIKDQGVDLNAPDLTDLNAALTSRASALETLMARSISTAAADRALSQTGGSLTSTEIAQDVGAHLRSLTDSYLNDEFGGALMHAQNGARFAVFDLVDNKELYASELEDTNTCEPCGEVDGTKYASVEEAKRDYPAGYRLCLGGRKCRGTPVAIASSESAPSVQ